VGPEVGAEHAVDHHRVAAGRAGPAEEGDLGALGGDAQLEPGRPGQRVDPGPAGQHDRVGPDPAVVGVDPDHPVAGHGQAPHGHPLADPRPQVDRRRGEGEGGGHRVGVAGAGLDGGHLDPGEVQLGVLGGQVLRGATASVSTPTRRSMATFRSSRRPRPARPGRPPGDGEPAPAPDPLLPVLEVAQPGQGHPGLGLVGVVHPHQRPRPGRHPRAHRAPLPAPARPLPARPGGRRSSSPSPRRPTTTHRSAPRQAIPVSIGERERR
jgi:hypothetical protein